LSGLNDLEYGLTAAEIALASLQMESDTAMVGSIERSGSTFVEDNRLGTSASSLLQQKKTFSSKL
jgi:hypothetical protein